MLLVNCLKKLPFSLIVNTIAWNRHGRCHFYSFSPNNVKISGNTVIWRYNRNKAVTKCWETLTEMFPQAVYSVVCLSNHKRYQLYSFEISLEKMTPKNIWKLPDCSCTHTGRIPKFSPESKCLYFMFFSPRCTLLQYTQTTFILNKNMCVTGAQEWIHNSS